MDKVEQELLERNWIKINEDEFKKTYKPETSKIIINFKTQFARVITYHKKYEKLELNFFINNFKEITELELFCIKFIINVTEK